MEGTDSLSVEEAYECMLRFLKLYLGELRDAKVIDVLSDGALAGPRQTVDPGTWAMWMKAVVRLREADELNRLADEQLPPD